MGLDMYLSASRYLSGWDHERDEKEKSLFSSTLKGAGLTLADITDGAPSGEVKFNVAYWRKANAIHAWFVKNVQGGKDECQSSDVSRESLAKLLADCVTCVADHDKAAILLPPQSGFFFGSTAMGDWYWEDLNETVKVLTAILANPRLKGWEFKYRASW